MSEFESEFEEINLNGFYVDNKIVWINK